jgi:mycothione reductase
MQFDQRAEDVAHQVFYIHPALTEVIENALLDALP